jgi:hypothetical protein
MAQHEKYLAQLVLHILLRQNQVGCPPCRINRFIFSMITLYQSVTYKATFEFPIQALCSRQLEVYLHESQRSYPGTYTFLPFPHCNS